MTVAVIFAAGQGTRMGGTTPKQHVEVCGKQVLMWTLERFQAHPLVEAVYVAALPSRIGEVWALAKYHGIGKLTAVVPGRDTALGSIEAALAALDGVAGDTPVLVHDGVRPVVTADLISRCIASTEVYGSGVAAIPAFETVATVDEYGHVGRVTVRAETRMLQAPQAFHRGDLWDYFGLDAPAGSVDCAEVMDHFGYPVQLVDGFRGNVKLTTPQDMAWFRWLVESGEYARMVEAPVAA